MILKFAKDFIVKFVNWIANMADKFGLRRNQFLSIFIVLTAVLSIVSYIIVSFIAKKVILNLSQSLMIFLMVIIALATVSYVVVALFLFKFAKDTTENTYKLLLLNILLFHEKAIEDKTASISGKARKILEGERISKELKERIALIFPEEASKIFSEEDEEKTGKTRSDL